MELKHLFIFIYGGALDTKPADMTMTEAETTALQHAKRTAEKFVHPEIGITVQCYNESLYRWESLYRIYSDGRKEDIWENRACVPGKVQPSRGTSV